ncbi:hypothetical protein GIB67_020616 [Kingdonia uniflora]|uniref:Peptidase S8/S53 domain-containing protein n=1 Tax=Kingdonia uniflora TaxID=39325 RepID=A0A7J7M939_9MAGN|nr:hypothetical protein GIB67_020616 [Kingdonia uniflora]
MLGCITAYPDHTLHVGTNRTTNFLSLNKSGGLWPASNYGTDAIMGIIDSGVWPNSASFRDDRNGEIPRWWKGMCEPGIQFKSLMYNCKLIGVRYFNMGNISQDPNISFVYNSPWDKTGHGTHTKSIAAGNYVRALEKGVLASSSTGNRSSDLMTVAGNPWSLTVGVSTIDRQLACTLTVGNQKTIIGWSLFMGRAFLNASLLYNETLTRCNSPALLSELTYNAIVVYSEGPRINNQISTVIESTVTGAIFISTDEREEYRFPIVTIKLIEAPTVINYAKSTIDPKATIKFRQTFLARGANRVPQIPEYSSRGPSLSYRGVLKPDVVVQGSLVLVAWSLKVVTGRVGYNNLLLSSNYNILLGTSMTCPQALGVAALLKGIHADWSLAAIWSAMMTTTNPLDNTNNLILDVKFSRPATGLDMAAGQIDPNKALSIPN